MGSARLIPNVADITAIAQIRAWHPETDTDDIIGSRDAVAGESSQDHVAAAGGIADERVVTVSSVVEAGGIVEERSIAGGGVAAAFGIVVERRITRSRVEVADGVVKERAITGGRVEGPAGIVEKQLTPVAVLLLLSVLLKSACQPMAVLMPPVVL